jgi:hypothetical protein
MYISVFCDLQCLKMILNVDFISESTILTDNNKQLRYNVKVMSAISFSNIIDALTTNQ